MLSKLNSPDGPKNLYESSSKASKIPTLCPMKVTYQNTTVGMSHDFY